MAAKAVPGDVKLDRFLALRRWLGDIGVCWNCRDSLAFVQVDRESGGPKDIKPNLEDCRHMDGGTKCRQRANDNRRAMPARK